MNELMDTNLTSRMISIFSNCFPFHDKIMVFQSAAFGWIVREISWIKPPFNNHGSTLLISKAGPGIQCYRIGLALIKGKKSIII